MSCLYGDIPPHTYLVWGVLSLFVSLTLSLYDDYFLNFCQNRSYLGMRTIYNAINQMQMAFTQKKSTNRREPIILIAFVSPKNA